MVRLVIWDATVPIMTSQWWRRCSCSYTCRWNLRDRIIQTGDSDLNKWWGTIIPVPIMAGRMVCTITMRHTGPCMRVSIHVLSQHCPGILWERMRCKFMERYLSYEYPAQTYNFCFYHRGVVTHVYVNVLVHRIIWPLLLKMLFPQCYSWMMVYLLQHL